ncbi:ABC transporter permease subunit [Acholeplasma granularum]|uniref:ABC transporter permease subunit n=1 Tax=Acholeplasma granularum TaxID=264635 RepID=UPI0004702F95|nr:sugar ABC transporter permease [Acholeplasma granularum]
MMNLELWKSSYNFKQYQKIEYHLKEIVKEQKKSESIIEKLKHNYYDKRKHVLEKKLTSKANLEDLNKNKRDHFRKIKTNYNNQVQELKTNFKFALNEKKTNARLYLLKVEVNYNKVLDGYDKAIKDNEIDAKVKKENFVAGYKQFYEIETKLVNLKLNDEINLLKTELFDNINKEKQQYVNELSNLKTYYKDKNHEYSDLNKTNLTINQFKKYEYKSIIKSCNKRLKELKKEYNDEKTSLQQEIISAKKSYQRSKEIHFQEIKKVKLENKNHYNSLSKEDKKVYRTNQKFVKDHEKSRFLQTFDKYEKKVFSKINPAYIYVLPATVGSLFFTILPFLFMIIASFFRVNLTRLDRSRFVGFDNFKNIINLDTEFQKAFGNTLWYAFVTVILLTIVVVAMSAWLARNTRIHNLAQTMIFTPHIASLVAISILWIAMLHPTGIINQALAFFGIEGPGWLIQENTSLISVSFVTIWKDIGYYVLIIISGLQAIPGYIYEAAKLDKSTKTKTFFQMTLPLLMPTLSFVFVTKFIASFKVFAPIEIMTNGGPMGSSMVLSYWIYKVGRIGYNYGNAMAGAIILTILIGSFTFVNYRYFRKQVTY